MLSHYSHARLFATLLTIAHQVPLPWDSPGRSTGVGCHALLQGIFPIQGSNPSLLGLLHWQEGSLPLVPLGSPLLVQVALESDVLTHSNTLYSSS